MSINNREEIDSIIDSDEISIHSDDILESINIIQNKVVKLIFYKNGFVFNNNKIRYYDNNQHRKYLEDILKGKLPLIDGNNNYKLTVVNNIDYNFNSVNI